MADAADAAEPLNTEETPEGQVAAAEVAPGAPDDVPAQLAAPAAGAPAGPDGAPAPGALDGPDPSRVDPFRLIEIGGEKADLKAVREAIGINQIDLANMLDVTVRTIKRWEQIGWEEPPAKVWDLLQELVYDHERSVEELVENIEAAARRHAPARRAAGRDPWIVEVPYFKNQDHYEQFPHRKRSQHAWGNAISRRAADILRLKGYRVYFYYPEAGELG